MTFEQWKKRPVYVTQCATLRRAQELNVHSPAFRCLPGYRDPYAQLARDLVAFSFRLERFERRIGR